LLWVSKNFESKWKKNIRKERSESKF